MFARWNEPTGRENSESPERPACFAHRFRPGDPDIRQLARGHFGKAAPGAAAIAPYHRDREQFRENGRGGSSLVALATLAHRGTMTKRAGAGIGKRFGERRSICGERLGPVGYDGAMSGIVSGVSLAEIGALVGDVARANMLNALLGGRALTAGELAWVARVTAQTASGHLARLAAARLVAVEKQGRHRYYRLASPAIAQMLESIAVAAMQAPPRYRPASKIDDALRDARTCYDHLAGRLGVALTDVLAERRHLVFSQEGGIVTAAGKRFFAEFGVDLARAQSQQRCFCRLCLDWSERRPHLAGAVGAALAKRCFDLDWVARARDSRAVAVTGAGQAGFAATFGVQWPLPENGSRRDSAAA